MNIYAQRARENFLRGYNCSQAVVVAFADVLGKSEEECARLASSFGGGMGRLREVCGAVSGMLIVAGLKFGYDVPGDPELKLEHYKLVQSLASSFRERNRFIVCRELLGIDKTAPLSPVAEVRSDEYYKKRPCPQLVADAADILGEYILSRV